MTPGFVLACPADLRDHWPTVLREAGLNIEIDNPTLHPPEGRVVMGTASVRLYSPSSPDPPHLLAGGILLAVSGAEALLPDVVKALIKHGALVCITPNGAVPEWLTDGSFRRYSR